jgi:hypothetical protein
METWQIKIGMLPDSLESALSDEESEVYTMEFPEGTDPEIISLCLYGKCFLLDWCAEMSTSIITKVE